MAEEKEQPEQSVKHHTSKLAIAAFVLGILSMPTFFLTFLPAVLCAFLSILKIVSSHKRLKGIGWALAGMVIPVVFFFLVLAYMGIGFFQDAPPILNDYTITSLTSADSKYNETYNILLSSFWEESCDPNGAPAIGLNIADVNCLDRLSKSQPSHMQEGLDVWLDQNAQDILRLWSKTEKARWTISLLAGYEQIADLTEPGLDNKTMSAVDIRYLNQIYCNYALLMTRQGKPREGLDKLAVWSLFGKKLSVTSRNRIIKFVCYIILKSSISTANEIVNDHTLQPKDLQLYREQFGPLSDAQLSLRNTFIFEYLTMVQEYQKMLIPKRLAKPNSTKRLFRNYIDLLIRQDCGKDKTTEEFPIWPRWFFYMPQVDLNPQQHLPWYYWRYNPMGSAMITISFPSSGKFIDSKTKMYITDDLFQYVLARRLGQEGDLTARAYGDKYIVDIEKKRIYSPGPDGLAFTEDDIWLPIEPAVLGLTETERNK
jgi:hypothetical protein